MRTAILILSLFLAACVDLQAQQERQRETLAALQAMSPEDRATALTLMAIEQQQAQAAEANRIRAYEALMQFGQQRPSNGTYLHCDRSPGGSIGCFTLPY